MTGTEITSFTLISGMGKDINHWKPSEISANAKKLLEKEGYKISRVVAFVADESDVENAKNLLKIERVIKNTYLYYRNYSSELFLTLDELIQEEMREGNLILDLTPLTKLLAIKLLELSTKYRIPSFYLGREENGEYYLIWIYYSTFCRTK